jgi:hypothetical protein
MSNIGILEYWIAEIMGGNAVAPTVFHYSTIPTFLSRRTK